MAIDTASDASALFVKIVKYGMRCQYVTPLLILSQHEFLSTLTSGVERIYQRSITRKELAEVAGFSSAAIYSYTASPSARDYRIISEDMRIAAIWRVSSALVRLLEAERALRRKGRKSKYVIDGQPVTLSVAAKRLGYACESSVSQVIKRAKIAPGGDIGHLKKRAREGFWAKYTIDGQPITLRTAAGMLGYASGRALSRAIRRAGVLPGGDISHMRNEKPRPRPRPRRFYCVSGVSVTLRKAAKLLGYATGYGLSRAIQRAGIEPGGEISHLVNKTPGRGAVKHYVVNGERVSLSAAARLLGFAAAASLYAAIKREGIKPGEDISHIVKKTGRRKK